MSPTAPPDQDEPCYEGVVAAAAALAPLLPSTPAWQYPRLDAAVGAEVVVKHENTQPTGAFKVRGGLALLAAAPRERWASGLVTASTGNHAQSIAYAAGHHGVPALIVAPTSAPEGKLESVRALGAEVVVHGDDMTAAIARGRELADQRGAWFVDPGGEPDIVHGHATVSLELFTSHPDLDAVYVPVGSGTSAAGICLVRDVLAPGCKVIGVQSAQAPAAQLTWASGVPTEAPCRTRASGLATGAPFALTQRIMAGGLARFLLVDDDAIDEARRLLATHAHTLAEGAGAAALAGALADRDRPRRIGVICSGGNADAAELASLG
ncbi:MAG: threonine/serine dehydratase [Acidimicrobiales bacterium]